MKNKAQKKKVGKPAPRTHQPQRDLAKSPYTAAAYPLLEG